MDQNNELDKRLAEQTDLGDFHQTYSDEFSFYDLVKQGKIEEIKKYRILYLDTNARGYGKLSDNPIHNLTYHFVILAAMLARACTEGGMSREKAYSLSDLYINLADRCKDIESIQTLHANMIIDYTTRMKYIYREKSYSKNVARCISIVDRSVNRRISVEDIASEIGINRSHLSRIFKKETGETLSRYIMLKKLDTAESMLKLSDKSKKSCAEVADCLGFSSQSHFIQAFKKYTGKTPGKL
jgi:AraC family transcriptional regulator